MSRYAHDRLFVAMWWFTTAMAVVKTLQIAGSTVGPDAIGLSDPVSAILIGLGTMMSGLAILFGALGRRTAFYVAILAASAWSLVHAGYGFPMLLDAAASVSHYAACGAVAEMQAELMRVMAWNAAVVCVHGAIVTMSLSALRRVGGQAQAR